MDPLTHTLLGATAGHALFHPKLGRVAALAGGLAGLLPDADVFIRSSADPLLAIEYHRHFTHALAFAPVGGTLVSAVCCLNSRWRSGWFWLWLCSTLAYLSHCLLDAATSYGTQLLWPFSAQRSGWDFISIIDPLFTLPLAIGLVWALRTRQSRPAAAALILAATYLLLGGMQQARAVDALRRLATVRGHAIERFEAMPALANNLIWRTLYLHDGRIYSDRVRVGWFSLPTVAEGWSLPRVTEVDLTESERARETGSGAFQRFSWFSDGWVARKPGDSTVLGDSRYTLSADAFDPVWGIRYTASNAPSAIEWVDRARTRRIQIREYWKEIAGGDLRYRPLREFVHRPRGATNAVPTAAP